MTFALLECARTAIDVASRRTVHALTDEHLAVGEQHCLGRSERLQDAAHLLPSRPRVGEIDALDRPRLSTALILSRNHEPLVRHRVPVPVNLHKARSGTAVRPDLRSGVEERPVVFCRDIPVRVLQRRQYVQAPCRSLLEVRRASSDAELGATRDCLAAIVHFAVESAHLPVVPPGAGLDDLELRIQRKGHPRVFERDVPIGLRVVDLRNDLEHRARKRDRKSTRLNSSHLVISYAVFCLKKKKKKNMRKSSRINYTYLTTT